MTLRFTPGWAAARFLALALLAAPFALPAESPRAASIRAEVTLPSPLPGAPLRGRLFLFVAKNNQTEPRLQSGTSLFGQDVIDGRAGQVVALEPGVPGNPEPTLGDLPPGDYFVQALFNVYTEFKRADGHTIWAHMDQWEGQHFAISPGNLYGAAQPLHVAAGSAATVRLDLDRVIPPLDELRDTEWVQRIKFVSPRLTQFWGRPITIGATVLLPKGYAAHPAARYPVVYLQGHFERGAPYGFTPQRDPNAKPSWARQREEAAAKNLPPPPLPAGITLPGALSNTETGSEFAESWTAEDFPRVIVVTFQHPTPYFDDSYGVNSPNCGPYGDAIMVELIPELERRFRMIKQPYARVLTGSSTGGWGSLALQFYYPDAFNGAWAFSPDPVDFRLYYGGVNIYEDDNAFTEKSGPGMKGGGEANRRRSQQAIVLGTQECSLEWWKHTPAGPDGYPLNVWDVRTGKIDHAIARQMRDNGFDLRAYLERHWAQVGPKLAGKIHVCAADTDGFYSHLAVRLLEQFLQESRAPHVEGSFQYGPPGSKHGWRPTTHAALIREMAQHIAASAPDAASAAQWHYP